MLPCDICGKSGHSWFDCPDRKKKPEGWKPPRLAKHFAPPAADVVMADGSTKHVVYAGGRKAGKMASVQKIANALREKGVSVVDLNEPIKDALISKPADPELRPGRGRPKSIEDMKAYKAEKQRKYRADKRLKSGRDAK